jgi:hypothetical protein
VSEKKITDPYAAINRPLLTVEDWRRFADSVRGIDQ